ncbi:ORF10 [macacine gammaherpesvirus 12]|uniref:ORF10 n=1 Tax=macacine gammaherpesvirus 12 TaxID=2560571 RepID=A0A0B5CYC6_9GAMA|nr:ORF10 [Macaca nemestrina rhadinovirus 2]AJE29649.1 ORF10 [Macaca nemestrina rhadinovirus 2]
MLVDKLSVVLGDWEVTFHRGRFSFASLARLQTYKGHGGYARIRLPFSLDQLLSQHFTFGLVPRLNELPPFSDCVVLVAPEDSDHDANAARAAPGFVLDSSRPLTVWVDSNGRQTVRFCLVFLKPVDLQRAVTYVFGENGGPRAEGATKLTCASEGPAGGPLRVFGEALQTSSHSFVAYFPTAAPVACLSLLRLQARPSSDDAARGEARISPKYVTFSNAGENVCRASVHTLAPARCKTAKLEMIYSPGDPDAEIVLGQSGPVLPTHTGGNVLGVYSDAEKTIQPGSSADVRVQLIFQQGAAAPGDLAFLVAGVAPEPLFVVTPTLLLSGCTTHLRLFNPNGTPTTIKRDTLVAAAAPCPVVRTDSSGGAPRDLAVSPETGDLLIDGFRVPVGLPGVVSTECHVSLRDEGVHERMIH